MDSGGDPVCLCIGCDAITSAANPLFLRNEGFGLFSSYDEAIGCDGLFLLRDGEAGAVR